MKRVLVCLGLVAQTTALPVAAKPIAFARGSTLMAEYGGGSMLEVQAFYAPSYRYSLGVSALRLNNDVAKRDQTVVRANYLLKRWNLPKAQGNAFVYVGVGSTWERGAGRQFGASASGFAASAGWQADYETRWLYSSVRMDWGHAFGNTLRVDTAQLGFAPYAHDYADWATFFVLQARNYRGQLGNRAVFKSIESAALIRFFRGNLWLEAGVTNEGEPQTMLMLNY